MVCVKTIFLLGEISALGIDGNKYPSEVTNEAA